MPKLLYITPANQDLVGIWKKIQMQINYFKSQQIEVDMLDVKRHGNNRILTEIIRRIPFTGIHKWKINEDLVTGRDYIYIRYEGCDFQFIRSIKKIKRLNSKIKIIVEIPTYPYDNEVKLSIRSLMVLLKDRWNRRKLHRYVDRILTFSNDEQIFRIPTIELSNAIDIKSIKPKNVTEDTETINLIAVANYAHWHGYDRFIKGMHNYYNNKDEQKKTNIVLHLVGEGKEILEYRSLVNKYNLQKNVVFYGRKEGNELDEIYNHCDIGIDALGRHRSNIFYNSTLKGKEYGAKGLPIISGVKTELDYDEKYKYYTRVPADESPIEMEQVISFYNQIYNTGDSKENIIFNIRKYTEDNFDISVSLKKVVDYLRENS